MNDFRMVLEKCNLRDLGHRTNHLAWTNRHDDDTFMKERLDQTLANLEWASAYNNTQVESLACINSGHHPLLACILP